MKGVRRQACGVSTGAWEIGEGMQFNEVLQRFLTERCPKRGIQPATMNMYSYMVRSFLAPALGDREASELTHLDFEALYADMLERGYDPTTIAKCHGTAHGAIHHAEREGFVTKNVVRLAETPKRTPKVLWVPSVSDVKAFIAKAVKCDPTLAAWTFVGVRTGMRPGEVCALRPADLDGSMLTVDRSIDISTGPARVKGTKTGRLRRIVVDDETRDVLNACAGDWTFREDRPWRPDSVSHRFRTIARELGIRITPRSCRHFHATQLLGSGLSARQVADRLGHSNPNITLSVYTRFIPQLDATAAQTIAEVLA